MVRSDQDQPNAWQHSWGNQQAFTARIAVNANGALAVTYYDFRNPDGVSTGLPTDEWIAFASSNFTNPASWGGEERLTDTSFDMKLAPSAGGFFVGDYQGLVAGGTDANSFSALFGTSLTPPSPLTRASGIFFRDPAPAGETTAEALKPADDDAAVSGAARPSVTDNVAADLVGDIAVPVAGLSGTGGRG